MKSLFVLLFLLLGSVSSAFSAAPPLSIADATISEGNSGFRDLSFVATIPQAVDFEVTAKAQTIDMTARAGTDYTASTGNRVVIPAGKTSGFLKIRVSTDTVEEKDEQFRIRLFAPTGATLLDGDALGTIHDDDYAGQITVSDASISEGISGQKLAKVLVKFSKPALHNITVRFETKDGTAKAPTDYINTKGTLLFKPGRLALDALVPVVGDPFIESDKNFSVNLLVSGLAVTKSSALVTIISDDVRVAPPAGGASKIAFVVSRNNGVGGIYVMNADGSNIKRLTPSSGSDSAPCLSPDGTKITFVSRRGGHSNIHVMNADGTGLRRLTDNFSDSAPRFSPDGKKIVWSGYREITNQIWLMNADGSFKRPLTTSPEGKFSPAFSPDGQKIVFGYYRENSGRYENELAVMGVDGSGFFPITASNGFYESEPSYSPDGTKILFQGMRYAPSLVSDIYTVNDNGSGALRLTGVNTPADSNYEPRYSPDGKHIAFRSERNLRNSEIFVMNQDGTRQIRIAAGDGHYSPSWSFGSVAPPVPPSDLSGKIAYQSDIGGGAREIFVMNANGSNATRLTTTGVESYPRFSRDGAQIAFVSQRASQGDIYKMNGDGTQPTRLTTDGKSSMPSWSPDAQHIVFVSARDGYPQIYVMNQDGTEQTRLSFLSQVGFGSSGDYSPAFSPDGQKIIYTSGGERGRIYVMNKDGSDLTLIDQEISGGGSNFYSPDAQQIVFASMRDGDNQIWLVNADGTEPRNLTPSDSDLVDGNSPCFSPGGGQIAFVGVRFRFGERQIYAMNKDGSNPVALTRGSQNDQPSWAPGSVLAPGAATSNSVDEPSDSSQNAL